MSREDDRMGNLFSKSSGRSPSVKPLEMTSQIKADDRKSPAKKKILVNDQHHEELTVQNVAQANLQAGGESDSDTVSLGVSTVSKMSVKTPPPGDMARSRASFRAPTPLRSMDIDQESMDIHKELQKIMKEKGYMEKFPSPGLLHEVKKDYRKMSIEWPEDDEGVICPCPPKSLKNDVLTKERIVELDEHVFSLPMDFLNQPLFDLVQYLVEEAKTELEEAYVLYRWLTSQTMDTVVTQNGQMDIPQDYTIITLQRLKRMSLCYADVFAEIVGYTTIECVKITGQLKLYPKDPCDSVTKTEKHTWCAVYLGREWRLVDCFLGAKVWHDTKNQRQQEKLLSVVPDSSITIDLNNFYFIPDPEDLIISHFPDRDYWQLLPRWVTKAEFLSMPYFKPHFICLKLSSAQDKITVSTQSGMCRLDLNFPKGGGMKFSYRLRQVVSKKSTSSKKASLNNFVFLETSQKRHSATLLVNLAEKGKYVLEIFGKCTKLFMEHQTHLCSFGINCNQGNHGFKGYPDNDRSEWGPGIDVEEIGMIPVTHDTGIVETQNGEVEVVFKVPDNLSFFQRITSYSTSSHEQEYCAVHRTEKQKVVFTARPAVTGDSCLQILVKDDSSDGQLTSVCNYLLRCSEPNQSVFIFPKIPNGRIGSRKELKKLGLRILSPKSSLVYSPESGRVDVKVQTTKAVFLKPELTHYLNDVSGDVSDFVVQTWNKNTVNFTLKLPKHGTYNFALYGKRPGDKKTGDNVDQLNLPEEEKEGMSLLYNILIFCNWPYKDCCEFPKTLSGWEKGFQLLCPQKKYLPAGSFLKFRVIVPGADEVAVLDGEDWQHLHKEDGDLWDGDIVVDDDQAGSTIMVKASTGKEYRPLLQYQILSSVDYAALKEQRKENCRKAKDRVKKLKVTKKWRNPPDQPDVINVTDEDNVSLQVLDDESEDDTRQLETESEAGSNLSVNGSSTSTLKAMEEANDVSVAEATVNEKSASETNMNGVTADKTSTSSSETVATERTTNKVPNKQKEDKNGISNAQAANTKDVKVKVESKSGAKTKDKEMKVKKEDNDVRKKDQKTNDKLKNEDVGVVKEKNDREVKGDGEVKGDKDESKENDMDDQLEPKQEKKEVSFALDDDDSLRSSSAESESDDYEQDEESEFESWQRKTRDQEQRDEERTILDFSLPVRLLLKRLRGATKMKDKEDLKCAMSDYQKKGLNTSEQEFQQARRMLSVLNLRDDIMDSLEKCDIKRLKIKVGDADRRGFSSEMLHEIGQARARLKAAEHVQRLHMQMTSTCIDVPTLSEIIRYVKPPELVHHVVMAMLLLMKYHEGKTRKWKKSHKRCVMIGTLKLYQNVHHVKIDEIDPTVAARARQLLEMYAPDEAGMVSPGVGALYAWVQRVVEEVLSNHDNGDEPIKPANIIKQRRLFKDKKPKAQDEYHDRIRSTSIAAVRLRYNELLKKDKTKGSRQTNDVRRSGHNEWT